MGRAAASRAEIDAGALDEVEFHWGSAYHVAVVDGVCTARRRDGKGGTLTDPLPEGLRDALRLAWGDAYDIGCEHGRWTAVSKDAGHRTLAGDTPAALNAEIRTDFAREGTL